MKTFIVKSTISLKVYILINTSRMLLNELLFRTLNSSIFEIVLTMEGTTPETGNTIQVNFCKEAEK